MKQISTIHLTSVPFRGLDGPQLEARFCDCRRKTDSNQWGQSRNRSGYFDWSSPIAILLSVNERCRTDSPPATSSGTDLHKAVRRFSTVEYVLSICSVRGGRAVACRLKCGAVTISGLRQACQQSFQHRCEQNCRHRCAWRSLSVAKGWPLRGGQI